MPGKFELKKAKNGEFYFNLKASNGETILTSETYKSRRGALNGIKSVQKNAPDPKRFQTKVSEKNGQFFFNLRAGNHEVIGRSEMYPTEKARDAGAASVMKHAPDAAVVEAQAAAGA